VQIVQYSVLSATDVFDWEYERVEVSPDVPAPAFDRDVTHIEDNGDEYIVFTRGRNGYVCHGTCSRKRFYGYRECESCGSIRFTVPKNAECVTDG
jgi:hypothetical protein